MAEDTDPLTTDSQSGWTPPAIDPLSVRTGDMPGDKIRIDQSHIDKANTIFPYLLGHLEQSGDGRLVVSVYGGSGVGKSEIASVLGEYCRRAGYDSYVLSGDNYPRRIPESNDLERLMTYRNAALGALAGDPGFTNERMSRVRELWPELADMNPQSYSDQEAPWMTAYHNAGRQALAQYLGTDREIEFSMVNSIIKSFREGADAINLKRMGRTTDDIRYERVDFTGIRVLVVEWTHGNNALLEGVDIPVFLFSTPAETLAHRLARGRDKNVDSPLISLVLEIEQERLLSQADRAALIIAKTGEVLSMADLQDRVAR